MSDFSTHREQEQEVSYQERLDPLFYSYSKLADEMELLKQKDPYQRFTVHCKYCGRASSIDRSAAPTAALPTSTVDIPIAPTFSQSFRTSHLDQLSSALSAIKSAEATLQQAQSALKRAREEATTILSTIKEANANEWQHVMAQFTVGEMILLTSGEIVRIEEVCSEKGRLIVSAPTYFRDVGQLNAHKRNISYRAVCSPESGEFLTNQHRLLAAREEYESARDEHLSLLSAECPSPCHKCGHVYCYSYHYANRSDLGGWEILCTSSTCTCYNCRENRTCAKHQHYDYQCCQCSLPPYCECSKHR